MEKNWTALQEQFAAAFQGFIDTCTQLDPALREQKTLDGQWSPKDVVAHMIGWEREATERFWHFLAGPTENLTYNNDAFNSQSVASRQHLTWDQALSELKAARQSFQKPIAAITADDLTRESRFFEWLESITKHYSDHIAHLKQTIELGELL